MRKTHGHRAARNGLQSGAYVSWRGMKQRCLNPRNRSYPWYGELGVKVCERWLSFDNFYADMGDRPQGKTLDRYPDPYGDYKPGNCRWASPKEQAHNKRADYDPEEWERLCEDM